MTLVDHTRVFVNEFYLGTEVNKEFTARVNREFANNTLTRFVQDLRNYMIHRGLPPLNRHLTIKPVEGGEPAIATAVTGFYLPTQDLREWTAWKADAKKYLDAAGDQIDLPQLVESYRIVIYKFHNEFDELLLAHHKADLEYLEAMQAALRAQEGEGKAND